MTISNARIITNRRSLDRAPDGTHRTIHLIEYAHTDGHTYTVRRITRADRTTVDYRLDQHSCEPTDLHRILNETIRTTREVGCGNAA